MWSGLLDIFHLSNQVLDILLLGKQLVLDILHLRKKAVLDIFYLRKKRSSVGFFSGDPIQPWEEFISKRVPRATSVGHFATKQLVLDFRDI